MSTQGPQTQATAFQTGPKASVEGLRQGVIVSRGAVSPFLQSLQKVPQFIDDLTTRMFPNKTTEF